jgi:hypothetical protein
MSSTILADYKTYQVGILYFTPNYLEKVCQVASMDKLVCENTGSISENQLIVGWVMGILSAPLGTWLHSFLERRRFIAAASVELRELRYRLAALQFILVCPLGKMDRLFLMWCKIEIEAYRRTPEQERLIETIDHILNRTDDEIAAANRAGQANGERITKSIPEVIIPYLNSQAKMIGLLSTGRQEALVNLLHQVEVINSKNREMHSWNQATFEMGNPQNHANAVQNSQMCMSAIYTAAHQASDWIRKFTDAKGYW